MFTSLVVATALTLLEYREQEARAMRVDALLDTAGVSLREYRRTADPLSLQNFKWAIGRMQDFPEQPIAVFLRGRSLPVR